MTTPPVDDQVRIAMRGRLDRVGGACLSQSVIHVLRRLRPGRIVLDISEVTMLDSAGVSALLIGHADAGQLDCRFVLVDPRPPVHWTLRRFGLLTRFELAEPVRPPVVRPRGPANIVVLALAGPPLKHGAER